MKFDKTIALFATLVAAAFVFFCAMLALFLKGEILAGTFCILALLGSVYGAAGIAGGNDI